MVGFFAHPQELDSRQHFRRVIFLLFYVVRFFVVARLVDWLVVAIMALFVDIGLPCLASCLELGPVCSLHWLVEPGPAFWVVRSHWSQSRGGCF